MAQDSDNDDTPPNPIVTACIEDALAPYRDLPSLPPELLEGFAETLDLLLTTHPEVAPVVERLRPRVVPSSSGAGHRRGAPATAEGGPADAPVTEEHKPTGTEGGRP